MRFYCSSCTCLACSECISDHKEHDKWPINDAADLEKKKIENDILPAVQNNIPHVVKKVDKIHRATVSVKSNTVSLKRKVDETFDEIIDI